MKLKYLLLVLLFIALTPLAKAQVDAPTNLTVKEYKMGHMAKFPVVQLHWDYQGNLFKDRVKFNIYRKNLSSDENEYRKIFSIPFSKRFYDKLVNFGATYSYYVTAVVGDVESSPSNEVEITVSGQPNFDKSAVVYGKVTDEAGNPLRASLKFHSKYSYNCGKVNTDDNGNFKLPIIPGEYIVAAMSYGYQTEFYDNKTNIHEADILTINENDSLELNFELSAITPKTLYNLSGKVTDISGNPVKAMVIVSNLKYNTYHRRLHRTLTDAEGNYNLKVPEGDSVVVYARPFDRLNYLPEFYDNKSTLAEADKIYIEGDVSDINFVLEEKPPFENGIAGTVKDTAGNPIEATVVAIRAEKGRFQNLRFKRVIDTDSLGNYSLENLVPGNYLLIAHPVGDYLPTFYTVDGIQTMYWREADSIYVDSTGIISDINFKVVPRPDTGFATINGFIKMDNTDDMSGKMITARDENGMVQGYAFTNKNGYFTIKELVPGTYTVNAEEVNYNSDVAENITLDYADNITKSVSINLSEESATSVQEISNVPTDFSLMQNYPNPFNPTTTIEFNLNKNSNVKLEVFNVLGQKVATLINGNLNAGTYKTVFDARNLSSGIYFYSIRTDNFSEVKKMTLMK